MCELDIYFCVISKNIQYKVGVFWKLQKIASPSLQKFDLGSIFNFVKGFLANMLIIIILIALLHFSPKI